MNKPRGRPFAKGFDNRRKILDKSSKQLGNKNSIEAWKRLIEYQKTLPWNEANQRERYRRVRARGKCEECNISSWLDKPISLQIHHINGSEEQETDLQLLCPNCHSQTENFGFKNKKHTSISIQKMSMSKCGTGL